MQDTAPIATEICRLITAGVAEGELVATVARRFPELTRPEFMAALQDATAAAERRIASVSH